MKTFDKTCAQGDILIRRISDLPEQVTEVKAEAGRVIVTHSETGHHHVMEIERASDPSVRMYTGRANPLLAWLKVTRPSALTHLRPHDTHEPIMFEAGIYEVRRQREHTPEGWRQVQD